MVSLVIKFSTLKCRGNKCLFKSLEKLCQPKKIGKILGHLSVLLVIYSTVQSERVFWEDTVLVCFSLQKLNGQNNFMVGQQ